MNKCVSCQKETSNPKFCSRNCAAKLNNVKFPKRKLEGNCKICNSPIKSNRSYCKDCFIQHDPNPPVYNTDILISELTGKRKYQKNSQIRNYARKLYLSLKLPMECKVCKYSKHVEICHIIPINKFDQNSRLSEVNHTTNLVALCPTHHWEFDNSLIDKEQLTT